MLVIVITKHQLHAVLLQDLNVDLSFYLSSLDETVINYGIFQHPWGSYKATALNDYFQSGDYLGEDNIVRYEDNY